jgi:hypothetical protein
LQYSTISGTDMDEDEKGGALASSLKQKDRGPSLYNEAVIPPLKELTQDEKDLELLRK